MRSVVPCNYGIISLTVSTTLFPSRPSSTAIDEYFTRCALLKKSINYVPDSPPKSRKLKARTVGLATIGGGGGGGANSEAVIREINQIHNANYDNEQRTELLGADGSGSGTFGGQQLMRRRTAAMASASSSTSTQAGASAGGAKTPNGGGGEMGQAMKYYDDVQERIAADMLLLTRNLREQTETANRIIRRDTEVVSTAAHLSDRNMGALGREAEKLEEHSRRAWKCWMWLMIGFVMVIFICELS